MSRTASSNNVAAISEEVMLDHVRTVTKTIDMRNVLPVPPGAFRKYKPPFPSSIAFIINFLLLGFNKGTFV